MIVHRLTLGLLVVLPALAGAADDDVSQDELRRAVDHLAADELEGRLAGDAGGTLAARWIAARLEAIGVKPAGDRGTWYQAFEAEGRPCKNVLGAVAGREHALPQVVIGAHYDHVGRHGRKGREGEVHNGADDNASGVAAVLEVARLLARGPAPRRTVVLALFDAEEGGCLGSAHYVRERPGAVFMLNLDMVGRLGRRLFVYGGGAARELRGWLEQANQGVGLGLDVTDDLNARSDSTSFHAAGTPALYFFTGSHTDYHEPTDDAALVDVPGLARITRLSLGVIRLAAEAPPPTRLANRAEVMLFPFNADPGDETDVQGTIHRDRIVEAPNLGRLRVLGDLPPEVIDAGPVRVRGTLGEEGFDRTITPRVLLWRGERLEQRGGRWVPGAKGGLAGALQGAPPPRR